MRSARNVPTNANTIKHFNEPECSFEAHYLINMHTCKGVSSPIATHTHTHTHRTNCPCRPLSMVIKCRGPAHCRNMTGPIGKTFETIEFAIKGNFIQDSLNIIHNRGANLH